MIYKIEFSLIQAGSDSIETGTLLVEEISATEAIKEAIKLIDEEFTHYELCSIQCVGSDENS